MCRTDRRNDYLCNKAVSRFATNEKLKWPYGGSYNGKFERANLGPGQYLGRGWDAWRRFLRICLLVTQRQTTISPENEVVYKIKTKMTSPSTRASCGLFSKFLPPMSAHLCNKEVSRSAIPLESDRIIVLSLKLQLSCNRNFVNNMKLCPGNHVTHFMSSVSLVSSHLNPSLSRICVCDEEGSV